MKDELVMMFDGVPHRGWKTATIRRSIERGAHGFEVTLSENWHTPDAINRRTIRRGMPVQAYIGDDLVVSGYVNDGNVSYDAQNHTINVIGRSRVGDLIDCSTTGKSFANQSLAQICTVLCAPFGINIIIDDNVHTAANQPFTKTKRLDLGEPIWDFIEELARIRAVVLTSNAAGDLIMTRAGSAGTAVSLELGKNVESANGTFSEDGIHSEYTVTAQQANEADTFQDSSDTVLPMATVKGTGRYRPMAFAADEEMDIAGCKTRAEYQKNVNEARAESITYPVTGWRQEPNGPLWTPNQLVTVNDPYQELNNAERLIVETVLTLGEQGRNTDIRVMPKGAYALIPEVEKATEGGL